MPLRGFFLLPAVVAYVYFTRILVYLMRSTMSYETVWIANLSEELAGLAFYCLVGVRFRPEMGNPYVELTREEDDAPQQV